MPLFLDLTPKIEKRLQEEAEARGITLSELVTRMVEAADSETEAETKEEVVRKSDPPSGKPQAESSAEIMDNIVLESVRQMKANQVQNRELAVQVITYKNNLEAELAKEQRLLEEYERKAEAAAKEGNSELAAQFLEEKTWHEEMLPGLQQDLASATEAADRVREAIKQEELRIRKRTAQALAVRSAFTQLNIQLKIARALDQFRLSVEDEARWMAIRDRVHELGEQAAGLGAEMNPLMDSLRAKSQSEDFSVIEAMIAKWSENHPELAEANGDSEEDGDE
jgi:phage shock protein A